MLCELHAHTEKRFKVGNKSWLLFKDARAYSDGRSLCRSRGGELLTLNNAYEQELLYQAYAGSAYDLWLGLKAQPSADHNNIKPEDFLWLSTGLPSVDAYFMDGWVAGEPNNNNNEEADCGAMSLAKGGKFNDWPCWRAEPPACQEGE